MSCQCTNNYRSVEVGSDSGGAVQRSLRRSFIGIVLGQVALEGTRTTSQFSGPPHNWSNVQTRKGTCPSMYIAIFTYIHTEVHTYT